MKNYRIRKETWGEQIRYYPQVKMLGLFWTDVFKNEYYDGGFTTFEKAKKELCAYLKRPVIEYLDVEC